MLKITDCSNVQSREIVGVGVGVGLEVGVGVGVTLWIIALITTLHGLVGVGVGVEVGVEVGVGVGVGVSTSQSKIAEKFKLEQYSVGVGGQIVFGSQQTRQPQQLITFLGKTEGQPGGIKLGVRNKFWSNIGMILLFSK